MGKRSFLFFICSLLSWYQRIQLPMQCWMKLLLIVISRMKLLLIVFILEYSAVEGIKFTWKILQGNEFAHIQMLPYHQTINQYDLTFPQFRLIDGPSVRQGRLQIKFQNRWRSICTKLTKLAKKLLH